MRIQKVSKPEAGFTLLEMLIATAVFGMVMLGVVTIFSKNHSTYTRGQNKMEIQQNARVALARTTREIRTAGYDPSGAIPLQTTAAAIQVAQAGTLTLLADIDGDDVTDRVTYRLQGTQLIREFSSWNGTAFSTPVSGEVAEAVGTLTFAYFDDASPVNNAIAAPVPTASLANIRRVTLGLVTTQQTVGVQETFTLAVDIRLRNL